ncbi:MAG: hypothetical protein PHC34_12895 [Candidatus Gastranaerophilales bacterium]|nr:hypothetical protein [Candidatus Gastranaerophilales bacterium]
MAICEKCKKEYISLKEGEDFCPVCKTKRKETEAEKVQDQHLPEKQKRFTSE